MNQGRRYRPLLNCLCYKPGSAVWLNPLFVTATANTSLRRNREKRIPKLCQRHAQKSYFILRQFAGKCIGNDSDGSCQFTWIHKRPTPTTMV